MRKARVIHIIGKRPVGGVGTVLLNYQQHMDPNRVQMDYFIFGEEEEAFDRSVKALGSRVYTVSDLNGAGIKGTKNAMESFFAKHASEYDIVHLHPPYIAGIVLPIAKKYGIKHRIVHSHATVYAETPKKALRNRALWMISQGQITNRIGCSDAAGSFLFGNKPYTVMKNAIDCDCYQYQAATRKKIREEEGIEDDALVVGNVGRFSYQKNQVFLIQIYHEIKKINPKAVLWLVGDGETKKEIKQKIKELGLTDVKFFGMVNNVPELYQAMDVMVMPSLFEGLPMVGVEAQASGLPVVFSDTITKEVDILGCPYLSLESKERTWAEATVAIAGKHGAEIRESEDYKAKATKLGFNIYEEARRLEDYYQSLLKR